MSVSTAIEKLENWFERKSDGDWEHHNSITLVTTDNPGWWLTIPELLVSENVLAELVGELLRNYRAQVTYDQFATRVYAPKLSDCVCAAAELISRANHGK